MIDYEREFQQSMAAAETLLEKTEDPRHRAILNNYRRHVHLEVCGRIDDILAPDMTVPHPVYRICWAGRTRVLDGPDQVRSFYNELGGAGAVLWNTDEEIAVADWGFAAELTLNQLMPGHALAAEGEDIDDPRATYHLKSRQAFVWPYSDGALLIGEHIYEDLSTREIVKPDPATVVSPERAIELVQPRLAELAGPAT
ncbi:MAG: hypothetical protein ACRDN9_15725 [Streptosporangiaceae bacterium]